MKIRMRWDWESGWVTEHDYPYAIVNERDTDVVVEVGAWRWYTYRIVRRLAYHASNLVPWPEQPRPGR